MRLKSVHVHVSITPPHSHSAENNTIEMARLSTCSILTSAWLRDDCVCIAVYEWLSKYMHRYSWIVFIYRSSEGYRHGKHSYSHKIQILWLWWLKNFSSVFNGMRIMFMFNWFCPKNSPKNCNTTAAKSKSTSTFFAAFDSGGGGGCAQFFGGKHIASSTLCTSPAA